MRYLHRSVIYFRYVSQAVTNVQVSKAKPVQSIVVNSECVEVKPVAAPRTLINNETVTFTRTPSVRNNSDGSIMSKSLNDIDSDVQLRRSDPAARPKPEVPVRPASLRGPTAVPRESDLHRTQCSVYRYVHNKELDILRS